jgi:hypothetical protein
MKRTYFPLIMACLLSLTFVNARAQDTLTVKFMSMTPHIGENLYLRVVDTLNSMEVARKTMAVDLADFVVKFGGLMTGQSYHLDFWADHNKNGRYDPPAADHTWRIVLDSVEGDTTITFIHNTNFTDINWPQEVHQKKGLTIAFSNFTPHVGQNLYLALKSKSGWEIERKEMMVDSAKFDVTFDTVMVDSSYMVDFWADLNKNGKYDDPPADHAWRITVDSVKGDTTIPFVHNTDFTNLDWMYKLTVNLMGADSVMNKELFVYLRNHTSFDFIDSTNVPMVMDTSFSVHSYQIMPDSSYFVDIYQDYNMNGMYDAPPMDHAWRIPLLMVHGDTTINFTFNNEYTDIQLSGDTTATGLPDLNKLGFSTYPNPVRDVLTIRSDKSTDIAGNIRIFSQTGALVMTKILAPGNTEVSLNVSTLKPGVYILSIGEGKNARQARFVKE